MAKGYIVVRYTGPMHTPGAFEAWNEAAWKWFHEVAAPVYKKLGAVSWRVTADWFGNTPRTVQMLEFDSVEQAVAAFASPEATKLKEQFIALGALDFSTTVHSLRREGKF